MEAKNSKLSPEEQEQLTALLKRVQLPVSYDLFLAIMGAFPSVPVELAVFNEKGEVLLFHREDKEFTGYHSPGTVYRFGETVNTALERVKKAELPGLSLTTPIILGWHENNHGNGYGQNPTRHEISLIHACELIGPYEGEGKFFPIDQLPDNMVPHHIILVPEIAKRFKYFKAQK